MSNHKEIIIVNSPRISIAQTNMRLADVVSIPMLTCETLEGMDAILVEPCGNVSNSRPTILERCGRINCVRRLYMAYLTQQTITLQRVDIWLASYESGRLIVSYCSWAGAGVDACKGLGLKLLTHN
jgi:hypothetical protein